MSKELTKIELEIVDRFPLYPGKQLDALFKHCWTLEDMLRKVQWGFDGTCCPICGRLTVNKTGHHSDCNLAKLLE